MPKTYIYTPLGKFNNIFHSWSLLFVLKKYGKNNVYELNLLKYRLKSHTHPHTHIYNMKWQLIHFENSIHINI